MRRAHVRVLEQTHQIGLGRLLQRLERRALEARLALDLLRDLPHEPLERQLPDQQFRALSVLVDLSQRDRLGPIALLLVLLGLHDQSRRPRGLPGAERTRSRLLASHSRLLRLLEVLGARHFLFSTLFA